MFENWLRIFTQEERMAPHKAVEKEKKVTLKAKVKAEVDTEIAKIREWFGDDVKEIEISLQDLQKQVPRNRQRVDAYRGLVKELKEKDRIWYTKSQVEKRIRRRPPLIFWLTQK